MRPPIAFFVEACAFAAFLLAVSAAPFAYCVHLGVLAPLTAVASWAALVAVAVTIAHFAVKSEERRR